MRHITPEALEKLKQWEGFVPYAYDDAIFPTQPTTAGQKIAGTLTIGYGHTGADVRAGQQITQARAEALLKIDLSRFEHAVEDAVTVDLTDNQFAALVSFAFNVGLGGKKTGDGFLTSSLLKKLNAGDYDSVPSELAKWNKTRINGKLQVSKGLVNRRAVEAGLWASGQEVATNTVAVEVAAKPMVTVQSATLALPIVAGVGTAIGEAGDVLNGSGPFQWAIAGLVTLAAVIGGILFINKHLKRG
jgi:lysozyme